MYCDFQGVANATVSFGHSLLDTESSSADVVRLLPANEKAKVGLVYIVYYA